MKKLFALIFTAVLVLSSCAEDPEISIDKSTADLSYKGGAVTFVVDANCNWDIICDSDNEDLITLSQTSGGIGSTTIHATLQENESNSILNHYITAVARGTKRNALSYLTITQGAPAYVVFSKKKFTADYTGGEFIFTVSANFPWTITYEGEGITVEPTSGDPENIVEIEEDKDEEDDAPANPNERKTKSQKIRVTLDDYEGDIDRDFVLNVTAVGDDAVVKDDLTITQTAPALTIGNRVYKIKKMGDGRWWMVQNLCYSPKGITIGDGLCGYWYPCSDTALEPDDNTDNIIAKGLLYADPEVFNVNITSTTCKQQEGKQGICPDGWHIPTLKEFMALVGKSTDTKVEVNPNAPYYDAARNQGSLTLLEEGGFNTTQAGYIMGRGKAFENGFTTEGYLASRGYITSTYIYCSTNYSGTQWYALVLN